MIEGGTPVTGEYIPERDAELLQIIWQITLLREKSPTERWEQMREVVIQFLGKPRMNP